MIKVETFSNVNFNTAQIEADVKRALDKTAQGVATDFNAVTATWKGRPRATIVRESTESRLIGVDDNRWEWNNNGTVAHTIRPRRARRLSFQTGYKRKTARRQLSSTSGGPSGPRVHAREVRHPGNKANDWNKASAEKRSPEFVGDVNTAISKI